MTWKKRTLIGICILAVLYFGSTEVTLAVENSTEESVEIERAVGEENQEEPDELSLIHI